MAIIMTGCTTNDMDLTQTGYSGQAGQCLAVNTDENSIEFTACGSGGLDTNAETACAAGEVLYGDGACSAPTGGDESGNLDTNETANTNWLAKNHAYSGDNNFDTAQIAILTIGEGDVEIPLIFDGIVYDTNITYNGVTNTFHSFINWVMEGTAKQYFRDADIYCASDQDGQLACNADGNILLNTPETLVDGNLSIYTGETLCFNKVEGVDCNTFVRVQGGNLVWEVNP